MKRSKSSHTKFAQAEKLLSIYEVWGKELKISKNVLPWILDIDTVCVTRKLISHP